MSEHVALRHLVDACTHGLTLSTRRADYSGEDIKEIVSAVSKRIQAVADDIEWHGAAAVGFRSAVKHAFQVIHERYENKAALSGLSTGFPTLDDLLGGIRPGELIALASEPCAGKSALAAQIAAHHAVQNNQSVCVFSMKRSAMEYTMRLIAALGSVNRQHLRDGKLLEAEWPGITEAIARLHDAKIVIDATPRQTVASLHARMRAALRLDAPKLVVIDTLEQMDKPDLAAELRHIAREFDCVVLLLAQSRGVDDAYTRLRARSLEDHADVILLLDRDQTDAGETARIVVARNRNGRTGEVKLRYFPQFARFEELPTP